MRILAAIVVLTISCWAQAQAQTSGESKSLRIGVFLVADTPFWNHVALFAQAAGESVGADVEVFNAQLSRVNMMRQLDWVASGQKGQFDALVFPNFLHTAVYMIEVCERQRIVCILFNSDLDDEERSLLRLPERRFHAWSGHLKPNDRAASAAMAQALVVRGRDLVAQRPLTMVGINGFRADAPAVAREQGMREVVDASDEVQLRQVVYTDWSGEDAYHRTLRLKQRYGGLDLVWSANYRSTTGILRALKMAGVQPGQDVFVNSFGLGSDIFQQLADGEIEITAGGHFVEGAWAVILAVDALSTPEPVRELDVIPTPLLLVAQDNLSHVQLALARLEQEPERVFEVDFQQFSRSGMPYPQRYEFSFEPVLDALLREPGCSPCSKPEPGF